MLENMCMNIELLEHVKSIYQKSCETRSGGKSSVPDPTPDRIKVAWFAITNKWLTNSQRKEVKLFSHGKKKGVSDLHAIPKERLKVEERGREKIKESFDEMIARQFPLQMTVT